MMSDQLQIPSPSKDSELAPRDYVQANVNLFAPALDLEVLEFDAKAQIDSVTILSVTVKSDTVTIVYQLAYSADYTCSGIEFAGVHERTIRGQCVADSWIFPFHRPTPERSTVDEF